MRGQEENEMLERVREKIAHRIWEVYGDFEEEINSEDLEFVDTILDTKAGNHTLKELIEMIDKGELVELAKDQSLPEYKDYYPTTTFTPRYQQARMAAWSKGQLQMLSDKFRRVEPLEGE